MISHCHLGKDGARREKWCERESSGKRRDKRRAGRKGVGVQKIKNKPTTKAMILERKMDEKVGERGWFMHSQTIENDETFHTIK